MRLIVETITLPRVFANERLIATRTLSLLIAHVCVYRPKLSFPLSSYRAFSLTDLYDKVNRFGASLSRRRSIARVYRSN